jgi:hypothetical protein
MGTIFTRRDRETMTQKRNSRDPQDRPAARQKWYVFILTSDDRHNNSRTPPTTRTEVMVHQDSLVTRTVNNYITSLPLSPILYLLKAKTPICTPKIAENGLK